VVNLERNASTTCRVADRGPYGVNKHGRWRGLIDLTPHVATSVKLDGRDKVRLFYLMPPKTSAMYKSYQWLSPPVKRSRDSM
jgi:rare lipoprotein A (peptidoglycan hydrolase)